MVCSSHLISKDTSAPNHAMNYKDIPVTSSTPTIDTVIATRIQPNEISIPSPHAEVTSTPDCQTPSIITTSAVEARLYWASWRVGPTEHLKVLRGSQKELLLISSEYMSPGLHNNSDTYHRLLRSQIKHAKELDAGQHGRQWIKKQPQRKAFVGYTRNLEYYGDTFMQTSEERFPDNVTKREIEEKKEFIENSYVVRERASMEKLGWYSEDIPKEEKKKNAASSSGSTRIFDGEWDDFAVGGVEDDEEGDEYDHLYSSDLGRPARKSDSEPTIGECEASSSHVEFSQTRDADVDTEVANNRARRESFVADLLTVRKNIEIEIEEEWDAVKEHRREVARRDSEAGQEDARALLRELLRSTTWATQSKAGCGEWLDHYAVESEEEESEEGRRNGKKWRK